MSVKSVLPAEQSVEQAKSEVKRGNYNLSDARITDQFSPNHGRRWSSNKRRHSVKKTKHKKVNHKQRKSEQSKQKFGRKNKKTEKETIKGKKKKINK